MKAEKINPQSALIKFLLAETHKKKQELLIAKQFYD